MRFSIAVAFVLLVGGCAMPPTHYERQEWATESFRQASAECYNYINSAAGRGSDFYLCMNAKGWKEVEGD